MPAHSKWTTQQRDEALNLYLDHGPHEAARRTGIPIGTIASWAHRSGLQTLCTENNLAAAQATRAAWQARREAMIDEIGRIAEKALTVADEMLDDRLPSKAKDAALTMAVLIDKAQLLAGAATQRTETITSDHLDREIARLLEVADAVEAA